MRSKPIFAARLPLALALGGSLILSACNEPETILAGKREPVRSVLQNPDPADLDVSVAPENTTQAISLPVAQNNGSWTHSIGTPAYRTVHPALSAAPQRIWSANIGQGDSRRQRITADPVVDAGRIFTLDSGSTVTATSTSGETLWQADVRPERDDAGDATGGGLAVKDGTLYVSSGYGVLTALDTTNGGVRWTQQLDATGSGAPTVYGDLVYLMAGDDTGWAIDTKTGRISWQVTGPTSVSNILGAPAPALTDELAIFAFGSGELQAVFRKGGLRRWDASVLGERPGRALSKVDDVTGTPVVVGNTVYAGNQAGRMVALDAVSGMRQWTANDGAIDTMYPIGGSIFAVTDRNELVRLDASDGSRIWGTRLPNYVKDRPKKIAEVYAHNGPVVAGGRVRVASSDGLLRSFDPVSGALVGTAEIPGGATTAPVVAGGTLYVVGRNGQLHAFR
ncbi:MULTISPECIES: PQQ-like beta-propeller repeat protein [Roseobacteraceae]|jgi:outer membrane protein assembly factor BamB|uniref:Outer membrane protein assembly factor BamB n=1 Tax=Pseudosulfitobacter pseudonitzschiae TaxID=1402135 RepID=A0A221JYP7_9RHOB|nr:MULTISPECIES: PQQ-like beta-propeller repeat protein [Roseobacteraceae]ASM71858.1 outer membrane protein assembly factor BamB [Pseudosulfitobacter pseudonitzschiae]